MPSLTGVNPSDLVPGVPLINSLGTSDTTINPASFMTPAGFVTDSILHPMLMTPRAQLTILMDSPGEENLVWLQSPRSGATFTDLVGGGKDTELRSGISGRGSATLTPGMVNNPIEEPVPGTNTFRSSRESTLDTAFPTDAENGPTPLRCDVMKIIGEGTTMVVYFAIETSIVPTEPINERLILSHRWEVTHQEGDNGYLTRVITGRVLANGGFLRWSNQNLDWFRNQFFHPIPLGFERR